MDRKIEPEILDSLGFDDPEAQKNRRDLRRINRLFRSFPWILSRLRKHRTEFTSTSPLLEIGSGEGDLSRYLEKAGFQVDGLDRVPAPGDWLHDREWWQRDLMTFEHWGRYSVLVGNLILHQFHPEQLRHLGSQWNEMRLLVFHEPLRSRFHRMAYSGLSVVMGMNHVSRHDGKVSIEAGFRDRELPEALELDSRHWHWEIQQTITGFYRCVGVRK
jgi:hypothetical protein